MKKDLLIIVRGGGDLATGIIYRLKKAGFDALVLETTKPAAIRRQVSFCEAVYTGSWKVEDMEAVRIKKPEDCFKVFEEGKVPVLIDPKGTAIKTLKPDIVVDAIIAKRNLGTTIDMAPMTVAVGPGFEAGRDVTCVVESMRGHNLGRIFWEGCALPDTKTPGNIGGYTKERVIHAAADGIVEAVKEIGDWVEPDDVMGYIVNGEEKTPILATIPGFIRGLIREGYQVTKGFKIADIDPRSGEWKNCFTISDKSRSIGGSVLEVVSGYARL